MIILLRGSFLLKSESKCTANDLQSFEKERLRLNPVFDSSDTVCVSRSCATKAGRASRTQIIFVLISLSDRQYVTRQVAGKSNVPAPLILALFLPCRRYDISPQPVPVERRP
jgi:hypothetical protein